MQNDKCFQTEEEITEGVFHCHGGSGLRFEVVKARSAFDGQAFVIKLGDEGNSNQTIGVESARELANFFDRAARVLEARR